VPWGQSRAHRWEITGFPWARIILEAQFLPMEFLKTAVEEFLDGIDTTTSFTPWTGILNSTFCRSGASGLWHAFRNQAYSSPLLDFDRLVDLSRSYLANVEDHL
jgi:hypothetical protein